MLVAYGPDGHPVIAEESSLEQLQCWSRERTLFCPNCRGVVHVRGGPEKRTQLHFAHQKGECAWSTESESVRHASGKRVLAAWIREQFPEATVTLEERLPEPNRIADIFVKHADGRSWAIEFQCAPLDIEEWRHRHDAYAHAGIHDIWIIGNNRREKQEAFIEAVVLAAREVLFLDPLAMPPRIWLRWPVSRDVMRSLQGESSRTIVLDGWVGRVGYGVSLIGRLNDVCVSEQGMLVHPVRSQLERRTNLLRHMAEAATVDEETLTAYLNHSIDERALRVVLLPLLRSYHLDPDLLRRYNYGRGLPDEPLSADDRQRVQKALLWRQHLQRQGFSTGMLRELAQAIPFAGPYAAFAGYMELFITIS